MNIPDRCEMRTYAEMAGICGEKHVSENICEEKRRSRRDVCGKRAGSREVVRGKKAESRESVFEENCASGMDVCAKRRADRAAHRGNRLRRVCRLARLLAVVLLLPALLLGACTMDKTDDGKVRDLEFTVIGEGDAPQELQDLIAQKKTQPFKLTYSDDQNLYIVVGYGPQSTGGYSITVEELYLTENSIFINTELKGPAKGEPAAPETSYPVVIVKTEYLEDPVVFD